MNRDAILLEPGSLVPAFEERTRRAIASGALQPIHTDQVRVEDGGVRFLVRVVSSLRRKAAEARGPGIQTQQAPGSANPFLPPDPALTVAPISRTHLAVLNKFNVLERHLLIVTRGFEHQEALLTRDDFRALCVCMAEYPSLGFYNGGRVAGASQPHKHLQLVPLPFEPHGTGVPMAPLLTGDGPRCPQLPFAHAFGRLTRSIRSEALAAADEAHALYLRLLSAPGIQAMPQDSGERQSAPYNLLVADGWMLAVPRVKEFWRGISINALGFAGSLFVKEWVQLELIRAEGPMAVLETVAGR